MRENPLHFAARYGTVRASAVPLRQQVVSMPENEPLRLRLDDAGDLPRRMTGPEELTYAKNFEVACHNYPLDQLDTLLRISNARAVRLDIEMQQVTLHQAVLRRMIAERKQQ